MEHRQAPCELSGDNLETIITVSDRAREKLTVISTETIPDGGDGGRVLDEIKSEKSIEIEITNLAADKRSQQQYGYYSQDQYGQQQYGQQQNRYYGQQSQSGYDSRNQSNYRQQGETQDSQSKGWWKFGNNDADQNDEQPPIYQTSFNTVAIRNGFVRRVYGIIAVQLLFTLGFTLLTVFILPMRRFFYRYWWIMIIGAGVYLICYMVLMCCQGVRRSFPANFIILGFLTMGKTLVVCSIAAYYGWHVAVCAIGTGIIIILLISVFAWQTKWDVTGCGCCLCILSLLLGLYGIIALIVGLVMKIRILFLVYSFLAVFLFSAYLLYDTQLVLGGRRYELEPEEYIAGAVSLYSDMIMIIVELMHIFGYFNH